MPCPESSPGGEAQRTCSQPVDPAREAYVCVELQRCKGEVAAVQLAEQRGGPEDGQHAQRHRPPHAALRRVVAAEGAWDHGRDWLPGLARGVAA